MFVEDSSVVIISETIGIQLNLKKLEISRDDEFLCSDNGSAVHGGFLKVGGRV